MTFRPRSVIELARQSLDVALRAELFSPRLMEEPWQELAQAFAYQQPPLVLLASPIQLDFEVSFAMPNISQVVLQPPKLLDESGQLAWAQSGGSELGNTGIGPFGVWGPLATDDFQELTAIYFRVLLSPGEGLKILICSDQSRSSVNPNLDKAAFGSFVRVYENDEFLILKILVHHFVVETFVQGGRTVITSRVYLEHALDNAAHIFLFNNGTAPITASNVRIWSMDVSTVLNSWINNSRCCLLGYTNI